MNSLFFWVQPLDNKSPDLIFKGREKIDNQSTAQKIVSEIYALSGKRKELSPEVTVRYDDYNFVIEVIPTEKDEENRLAPIVIYGEFTKEENFSEWVETSCDSIREVVGDNLKRTLEENTLLKVNEWFNEVLEAKKNKLDNQKRIISITFGSLVPVLVGWLLQANGILTLNPIEVTTLIGLNNLWVMLLILSLIKSFRSKTRRR